MSLIKEYMDKLNTGWGITGLMQELFKLISDYNTYRNTFLFVYSSALSKPIPGRALVQDDYYIIHDLLKSVDSENIDFYIETPGGSGETAEEIARFLHNKFKTVSFVISGEAKSAGTLLALSADEILMTSTASLGPIDAQIQIGRFNVSAHDYLIWIEEKRKAIATGTKLDPIDITMIAQITPGELKGVDNSLNFAKDLVIKWLPKHKFKNWDFTETRKSEVTDVMKVNRAKDIADVLTEHSKWRSHGRSLKIEDLESKEINLRIKKIDEDSTLSNIVYRIQTVCRLIYETSTTYKIFSTCDNKIFKQAIPSIPQSMMMSMMPMIPKVDLLPLKQNCPKCGKEYKLIAKFAENDIKENELISKGYSSFPKDSIINCDCGFVIDLSGIRNDFESKINKKILP